MRFLLPMVLLALPLACTYNQEKNREAQVQTNVFVSPLGKELAYPTPSEQMLRQYEEAKQNYLADPDNADNIIWYGRRSAYLAHYQEAIAIYTEGIKKFPEDARFYRHRGHRYISIRQYDDAIADLENAVRLIQGNKNEIEPDGIPNAQGIPVSTLHGNIYYHLGLAYYLKHEYNKAFDAYVHCRDSGSNPDNIVSSTHWLYMIQRRLGDTAQAAEMLEPIFPDMEIIENHDYYTLCLLYKGLIPIDSITIAGDSPASDALSYGIANWYFYNNNKEKAQHMMQKIVEGRSWSSFGYLAAESDLMEYQSDE